MPGQLTAAARQAGRQASQGRLNTVIISELCLPWPGWPSYTYLLAGWGSQPVIENQPTPRANVSLSLLNSLFQALDYLSYNMCDYKKILLKAQRTQGIEYFDSINTFNSKQKRQQALESWSNFSLVWFGKGREIPKRNFKTTLKCKILVTTKRNPYINFENSI